MPLPSPSSSAGASSSRRPTGQPKTGRKQYSACGACRLRRVRCDLKDLQDAATGDLPPVCTNCSERGINCVDEYVELKITREQISRSQHGYADNITQEEPGALAGSSGHSLASPERLPMPTSIIPQPHPDFFRSAFFRQFSLMHPIFDPADFLFLFPRSSQFGTANIERKILAMVLVAWSASFGLDERGVTVDPTAPRYADLYDVGSAGGGNESDNHAMRTDALVSGILNLVDSHGLLRNPSWDGVRLLLLLWPLTQRVQRSLERITTYETILSQIHALCRFGNNATQLGQDIYNECLPRARVFWYAYVHESTTNALRGRRLVMDEDDLEGFQQTLPPSSLPATQPPTHSSHSSGSMSQIFTGVAAPSTLSETIQAMADSQYRSHPRVFLLYQLTTYHFELTLGVAGTCRRIYNMLTGPGASRTATHNSVSIGGQLMVIWNSLSRSWNELQGIRQHGLWNGGMDETCSVEDVDVFISSWQIFVFECHNIIRDALKQRVLSQPSASSLAPTFSAAPYAPSPSNLTDLHGHATHNCRLILPAVLTILKRHLQTPRSPLFRYDTGLAEDGCAFAGFMLAQSDLETDDNGESLHPGMGLEEGIEVCVNALGAMGWTLSRSDHTRQKLMAAWEARKLRDAERHALLSASAQQWTSQTRNQPYITHTHESVFYPSEHRHGPQPWNNPTSPDIQNAPDGGYADASFMFPPHGSFGYDPNS